MFTWDSVSAISESAGALLTGVAVLYAIQQTRAARAQASVAVAALSADRRSIERSQAEAVAAWIAYIDGAQADSAERDDVVEQPVVFALALKIANLSSQPVYEFQAVILRLSGAEVPLTTVKLSVLPPSPVPLVVVPAGLDDVAPLDVHYRRGFDALVQTLVVSLSFRDARGRSWRRGADGLLEPGALEQL